MCICNIQNYHFQSFKLDEARNISDSKLKVIVELDALLSTIFLAFLILTINVSNTLQSDVGDH